MRIARRHSMIAIAGAFGLALPGPTAFGQTVDVMVIRDELMARERESWGYLRDKNLEGMRGYLADDGLLIFADGKRYNKREMLALMADFRLDSFAIEPNYAVRMLSPDVATLLYRCTYTSSAKGGPAETAKVLSSSIYVRRNHKWWSVLYQETPIK